MEIQGSNGDQVLDEKDPVYWRTGNGDAWEPGEEFTLDELQGGKVEHRFETLTAEQFANIRTNC